MKMKINPIVVLVCILIIAFAVVWPYVKPRKTIYCHYEQTINGTLIPRYECVNFKIISRDVNSINLKQFESYNFTVFECGEYKPCNGSSLYFARYNLNLFCKEYPCRIDGIYCGEYYVDFFDETFKGIYEEFVTEKNISSKDELKRMFDDCRVV